MMTIYGTETTTTRLGTVQVSKTIAIRTKNVGNETNFIRNDTSFPTRMFSTTIWRTTSREPSGLELGTRTRTRKRKRFRCFEDWEDEGREFGAEVEGLEISDLTIFGWVPTEHFSKSQRSGRSARPKPGTFSSTFDLINFGTVQRRQSRTPCRDGDLDRQSSSHPSTSQTAASPRIGHSRLVGCGGYRSTRHSSTTTARMGTSCTITTPSLSSDQCNAR